jgi:ubiquinone/menaquinone biosynthesis C-methylase UbiE
LISVLRRIEWRRMRSMINLPRNVLCLDIACGDGALDKQLSRRFQMVGVDSSRRNPPKSTPFVVSDGHRLPFPDSTFDMVVCSSALEYFDERLLFEEMSRVLGPNGEVVITADSETRSLGELREEYRRKNSQIHFYTIESLTEKLEASGFEVIESEYLLTSLLTDKLYKYGIKKSWVGRPWNFLSVVAYYPCVASDFLFRKSAGHTVIVHARKRGSSFTNRT